MNCTRKFLFAGLVLCAVSAGWAMPRTPQQAPSMQPQDPRARIRTTVSLVVVPVTVKNGAGELVTDLLQKDFRIFEDGIEQQISLFSVDAFPLSAAVLIDDDLKRSSADRVQKTLETLSAGFCASRAAQAHRSQQFLPGSGLRADDERAAREYAGADGLSPALGHVGGAPEL